MTPISRTLLSGLAAMFASSSSLSAFANTPDRSEQLDPVVVSAPGSNSGTTVIHSNRIEQEQAISLRDLFKQTPEVNVGGGQNTSQKVYVRSLNERMLNVTIDGASQPEAAYHHNGQIMVEPELLKQVEVEAGTGSATAGPGALGGALRFITKSAEDLLRPGERFGALFKGLYQSVSEGKKGAAIGFGKLGDNSSFVASFNRFHSDDFRDGNGNRVRNSAAETTDTYLKLNTKIDNIHRFSLSHERYQDEGIRNKKTNLIPMFNNANPRANNPPLRQRVARETSNFSYDFDNGNPLLQAHLGMYLNDNSMLLGATTPAAATYGTRSHGLNLANLSRFDAHKLSYGYDYRHDSGYSAIPQQALPHEIATVHGVYLQDDYSFMPAWMLRGGLRYDSYHYRDIKTRQYAADGFSPNAALSWNATEQLRLRLAHARALRGVGPIEPFLTQYQENLATLAPERARNTELDVEWKNGPWRANGALFRQYIDNYLGYDSIKTSQGQQRVRMNMGNVRVSGYSASIAFQQGPWSSSLGVSVARASLNDEPLNDHQSLLLGTSTGRTWVAQVDYAMPSDVFRFGWNGRLVEQLDRVPIGSPAKPGYAVHDVYGQWQPNGNDDFSVKLAINNMFDRYYLDQASFGYFARWQTVSGLPEPGRDLRLTMTWRI